MASHRLATSCNCSHFVMLCFLVGPMSRTCLAAEARMSFTSCGRVRM